MNKKTLHVVFETLRLVILLFLVSAFVASSIGYPQEARVIRLSDSGTANVPISMRGTVLSFPMKPSKVILGKANSFGIEYCDNDLAISPLSTNARSNLFVYLYGRRFSFDLVTSVADGSAVILIRDAKEVKGKTHD